MPDGDHTKIIRARLGAEAPALSRGPFVLASGEVIGHHDGYARFTIGQRRGLPGGFREPMFVVGIRPADRAVVIGPREQLLGRGLVISEVNWLVETPLGVGSALAVQIRHRATPASASIIRVGVDEVELALDDPVAAITPGQSAVLYDGERVLGGGVIERGFGARPSLPVLAA